MCVHMFTYSSQACNTYVHTCPQDALAAKYLFYIHMYVRTYECAQTQTHTMYCIVIPTNYVGMHYCVRVSDKLIGMHGETYMYVCTYIIYLYNHNNTYVRICN